MRPNPQETADLVTYTEEIMNGNENDYFGKSVKGVKNCKIDSFSIFLILFLVYL